jgi:hypothetical protein
MILDREEDLNCCTALHAYDLAFSLRQRRNQIGQMLLFLMQLPLLTLHLNDVLYPSQSWLKQYCSSINVNICRSQQIEIARRFYCDKPKNLDFFTQHSHLLDRDPRLIWNADETQLNANKQFKVLCSKGKLPLVTAQTKLPHLTGFVSISATGQVLKPLIILKFLKKLKTLSIFEDHCFFSTSFSGWITKDLFTYFALIFIVQISQYQLDLP